MQIIVYEFRDLNIWGKITRETNREIEIHGDKNEISIYFNHA